jgi:hypothetical protein
MRWLSRIWGGGGNPNTLVAARAAELSLSFLKDGERNSCPESLTEVMALIMFGLVVDLKSEGINFDGKLLVGAFVGALETTAQREFSANEQDVERFLAVFGARTRDYRIFMDQISDESADYDGVMRGLAKRFGEYLEYAEKGTNVVGEPPLKASDFVQKMYSHAHIADFFATRLALFNRYATSQLR